MFSHVIVGVNNLETSKKFYDATLGTLGIGPGVANKNRYFYRTPTGMFGISTPINGEPACIGNGSTVGFNMTSSEQVDAFHAAGLANGGTTCEEPPGLRDSGLYLAYLRDPDGNKLCALHRPSK
jgi:catechol 2,3-dioxygenase-like lactoylglutathione lyase family enzyme